MKELWKIISGYPKYKISNLGRVERNGRFLSQYLNKDGYPTLGLSNSGIQRTLNVHRLVAIAFIPNPKNLPQVNHKDGIKTNIAASNLEWSTYGHNLKHAYDNSLRPRYKKLTLENIATIRATIGRTKELAHRFNVNKSTIKRARKAA